MAGTIAEWYGYAAEDTSDVAAESAAQKRCPFVPGPCTKTGGVCSVRPAGEVVTVCPKRLYGDGFRFLREIADDAFAAFNLDRGVDGLPTLVHGDAAVGTASASGIGQVGVFGQNWAGEVKLPAAVPGGARYSVDFTLVVAGAAGDLLAFVPVEVQSIDTTGSYGKSRDALVGGRRILSSSFGMNWENVNKRILPQLIIKGLMLQSERLCTTGLYFVTPEPVHGRIMSRLGGADRLRQIPKQPGSITFIRLQQDMANWAPGTPVELRSSDPITISTSDMSLAFISPENLPGSGAYEGALRAKMQN